MSTTVSLHTNVTIHTQHKHAGDETIIRHVARGSFLGNMTKTPEDRVELENELCRYP